VREFFLSTIMSADDFAIESLVFCLFPWYLQVLAKSKNKTSLRSQLVLRFIMPLGLHERREHLQEGGYDCIYFLALG